MLDAVGELSEDIVRDVRRALADEVYADALGADELNDLNDLLDERLGRVAEEQVRFIKEEDHARLLKVADLRQTLEELGQHPEEERTVHGRALDKALAGEDVDITAAVNVRAHPVTDIKLRLAEEQLAALALEGEQRALNGADAGGGDVAVGRGELGAVIADVLEHGAQILEVEQEQAVIVRHSENDVEYARLYLGQAEEPCKQRRPHGADGNSDGMTLITENVPEAGRVGLILKAVKSKAGDARTHILAVLALFAHAAQVALDVRKEHRHAHVGKGLCHDLHGDGLAGAGRAGDKAVAVSHGGQQIYRAVCLGKTYLSILVHSLYLSFPHIAVIGTLLCL